MFTWDLKSASERESEQMWNRASDAKPLDFQFTVSVGFRLREVGSRILPADQFIQSDAGRAGKSDRNETQKQTNLYIILKPG